MTSSSKLALRVGTIVLKHRLVVPPHCACSGRPLETDRQFESHSGYWVDRVRGRAQSAEVVLLSSGIRWCPASSRLEWVPTGRFFRYPKFLERMGEMQARSMMLSTGIAQGHST
jgi:hypothetical protein